MEETKHSPTPGPWPDPEKSSDGKGIFIEKYGPGNDNWKRLSVEVDSDDCDSDTAMANARLIAAAPDLLAACQNLPINMLDREDNLDAAEFVDNAASFMAAMRLARTAIAKAEGKQ